MLLTRTPERAAATAVLLERAGFVVELAPVTETAALPDDTALIALLRSATGAPAGAPRWLVATSVNTVRALARTALQHTGVHLHRLLEPALSQGLKTAAVGRATADAFVRAGVPVDFVPTGEQSAEGMLAQWPAPHSGEVHLPQSERARPVLAHGLAALGFTVHSTTAYRVVEYPAAHPLTEIPQDADPATAVLPMPEDPSWEVLGLDEARLRLAAGRYAAVVGTSPTNLTALLNRGLPLPAQTRPVAIGRPTARAAEALGLTAVTQAREPSPEKLVEAVLEALGPSGAPSPPASEDPGSVGPGHDDHDDHGGSPAPGGDLR